MKIIYRLWLCEYLVRTQMLWLIETGSFRYRMFVWLSLLILWLHLFCDFCNHCKYSHFHVENVWQFKFDQLYIKRRLFNAFVVVGAYLVPRNKVGQILDICFQGQPTRWRNCLTCNEGIHFISIDIVVLLYRETDFWDDLSFSNISNCSSQILPTSDEITLERFS